MDYHRLQRTLFDLDPTDLKEDYAKLKAQAQGGGNAPSQEPVDYLKETAQVKQGSLELDGDYSLSDFAALAGVVTEGKKQKHADQVRGSEPMPKAEPGRTKHPMQDRLVGEGPADAFRAGYKAVQPGGALGPDALERGVKNVWNNPLGKSKKKTKPATNTRSNKPQQQKSNYFSNIVKPYEDALTKVLKNPKLKAELITLLKKVDPDISESKEKMPKPRDPNAQYMNDLRKSGAMGQHKNKKKAAKMGQEKHKGKQYESIKDELLRRLKDNEL